MSYTGEEIEMGYWDKKTAEKAAEKEEEGLGDLRQLEESTLEELGGLEKSFRERMKQENNRFRDMCDTEYWVCVCFTSRAQREEFMTKVGLPTDEKYIDGREMAKAFRKSIKTPDLEFAQIQPFGKEYIDRAMD